ncbi:MAG TPA: GEVED domain-containing protein [Chitinophaga sp.]|uniref:GEVED domain-containing protein n=1 Tax=Chitinophaga sp. TaxID=1869181 RepID=UPI002B8E5333|nr:GEVED domain-containing protein [Chitinophaga sp.]HVI46189.1 GEVED domain-containing protein [Chitinophaga sp.]
MKILLYLAYLLTLTIFTSSAAAQAPAAPSQLKTLGTRTWIRLNWLDNAGNETGYKVYWSASAIKPATPGAVLPANTIRYYINGLATDTNYNVWVEAYNTSGASVALQAAVVTSQLWTLDPAEASNLSIPSSAAVPAGMQLYWQDEFNDQLLNRNKWSTNYYSTIDFKSGTNLSAMLHDSLPQPGIIMNGSTIQLVVNDTMPAKPYWSTRKVSSIQTYDWRTNERYLDNRRGGYYEIRVRRSNTPNATSGLNVVYWLDSPGPDLKYYMEQGNTYNGVTGVRPRGQAFEIDVFEQSGEATTTTVTPFTMHGNVAADGTFQGNLTTYNATLSSQQNWATHGLLWTAAGIKYYINGVLVKEWSNTQSNMSPNHFMNIFLGNYYGWTAGMTNSATMEVDYIRGYQWPVTTGNELPNEGFEYGTLYPWSGGGTLSPTAKRSGNSGLALAAGQSVVQYVFLDHSSNYRLGYWLKGSGILQVKVENLSQVTGAVQSTFLTSSNAAATFSKDSLSFKTGSEYADHMRTVKLTLTNTGNSAINVDDLSLMKGGDGGTAVTCSAAGGTNATDRYITSLTTAKAQHNISYTNSTYPPNGYGVYTADSIGVYRDSAFTLNMINSTNTKWSRVNVYADWNGNGSFTDSGELLFTAGAPKQDNSGTVLNISRSITVPSAVAGKVRIRVRFYDAWNTDPGPCGQVDYTTTQDFFISVKTVSSMQRTQQVMTMKSALVLNDNAGITVYPNPAYGNTLQLEVQLPAAQQSQIGIYDLKGRRMYNEIKLLPAGSSKLQIPIGDWPAGMYMVNIQYGKTNLRYKFIRQ